VNPETSTLDELLDALSAWHSWALRRYRGDTHHMIEAVQSRDLAKADELEVKRTSEALHPAEMSAIHAISDILDTFMDPEGDVNATSCDLEGDLETIANAWSFLRSEDGPWDSDRFVLGSRPTPPALDPFAWNSEVLWTASGPLAGCVNSTIAAWVAWSRFCCWAAQSNLAAHFLPTVAAARTRASNGRDVPPATVLVELPVDTAAVYAAHPGGGVITTDHYNDVRQACRRALGGGA